MHLTFAERYGLPGYMDITGRRPFMGGSRLRREKSRCVFRYFFSLVLVFDLWCVGTFIIKSGSLGSLLTEPLL